jgi:hypothetical protein
MPFIGKESQVGAYNMLDNLTASATASYSLTLDSTAFVPESANHLLVSLNGVIQKAGSSYTVSGSTLTFSSTLASSDSIDFVLALGNVLDIGTPSDATVTNAKTNFVSTSSAAGLQIKGDGTTDGTLQLNCSQNSHGIKLKSPAHSASQSYTLTFPTTAPSADKFLKTDGSGNLSFADAGGGIEEVDQWRVSTNETTDWNSAGRHYITSGWERVDNAQFEKIGTGMSESSGVFTFPSTGKYYIRFQLDWTNRNSSTNYALTYMLAEIGVTVNNSSYSQFAHGSDSNFSTGAEYYHSTATTYFLDVSDTSNIKVKMGAYIANPIKFLGNTGYNKTHVTFIRLGDT